MWSLNQEWQGTYRRKSAVDGNLSTNIDESENAFIMWHHGCCTRHPMPTRGLRVDALSPGVFGKLALNMEQAYTTAHLGVGKKVFVLMRLLRYWRFSVNTTMITEVEIYRSIQVCVRHTTKVCNGKPRTR